VDVEDCRTSHYEILQDPAAEGQRYTRAFQMDSAGKQTLLQLARSVGSCGTCTGHGDLQRGFRAEVRGVVTALAAQVQGDGETTTPAALQLTEAVHSNGMTTVCDGSVSTALGDSGETNGGGGGGDPVIIAQVVSVVAIVAIAVLALFGDVVSKRSSRTTSKDDAQSGPVESAQSEDEP